MNNNLLLFSGGILHLAFVVFHLFFWRLFKWKCELKSLNPVNKGVLPVMNICLIVVFITSAYISFFHQTELLTTNLGNTILAAIAGFWMIRTILQFIYFDFHNPISVILIILFLCLFFVYLIPVIL